MLSLVVSYDYELFLGENYKPFEEILIAPTNQLLDLMQKYNIKSTFFVDVCCVLAHKKFGLTDFVDAFENQVHRMLCEGHDVQLHIHPNWLVSEYLDGRWNINTTNYTLHSFGSAPSEYLNMYNIIDECIEYLQKIGQKTINNYRCIAYRAGGYSVQPHEKLFEYLYFKGIRIDSSVCKNFYCKSDTLNYDFRNVPKKANWYINPKMSFSHDCGKNSEGLLEIPILSEKNNIFKKLFIKEYSQKIRRTPLNGSFISLSNSHSVNSRKRNKIINVINYMRSYSMISFDSMPSYRIIAFIKKYALKNSKDNPVISIICHPKMVDMGLLENMEKVFHSLQCEKNIKFTNMSEIHHSMIIDK